MSEIKQSFRVVLNTYPDIAKKIKVFWGHKEFSELVHKLLHDTRGHTRAGFPMHVTEALLTLQQWHDYHRPQWSMQSGRNWPINSRQDSHA